MSSIKKTTLIVNSFIFLAFMLYFFSCLLPIAGAIANQGLIMEDNGDAAVPTLDEVLAQNPVSEEGLINKGNSLYSLKKYELSMYPLQIVW
jgi:ABC-type transport system involved in multi-copper enzyme maturation permease subunit